MNSLQLTRERERAARPGAWILWLPATEEQRTYHRGDGASSTASNFVACPCSLRPSSSVKLHKHPRLCHLGAIPGWLRGHPLAHPHSLLITSCNSSLLELHTTHSTLRRPPPPRYPCTRQLSRSFTSLFRFCSCYCGCAQLPFAF